MKRTVLPLAVMITVVASVELCAQTLYWDINGATAGAGGATPTGTWDGALTNWSLDSTGSSATQVWGAGNTAVFSAGTDATGAFTITVTGTQPAGALTVEEGTVSIAGGAVSLGAGAITVASGTTLSTDSSLRISTTAGSKLFLDGSTLRTTNPGAAGTFFDVDTEIVLGAGGGTFSHTTANILNIVQTATKITGTGSLTKTGAGVLAIASTAGNNTYSGGTIVNEGELRMRTVVNTLPVTTAMTVNSPGIFNLNGVSTQIGSLTGAGLVGLANGTLTVGNATSTTYSGSIRDTANAGAGGSASVGGSVTKTGAGTLTLTGLNIHTGTTTLNAGGITVDPGASLSGATANLTVNGGTLNLNNAAQTIKNLAGSGGTINLGSGHVLTSDPIANSAYSGTIAGPGGLTRLNVLSGATARTLTLSGNNSYDGTTTISGGAIQVGSASALGSTVGGTTIDSGASVLFDGVASNFTIAEVFSIAGTGSGSLGSAIFVQNLANITISSPVTLTGAATVGVSGAGTVAYTNPVAFTASNQTLTLQGGALTTGNGGTISGVIALGTGGVTKLQGGKWVLSAANTYDGATTISAGTLVAANDGALGTTTGATTVASGAALGFQGNINYTGLESVSIAGTGVGATGALLNVSGNNTFAGPVTMAADSSVGVTADTLTLSGGIGGGFNLSKVGTGTLILPAANTYTGTTTVAASGGTLTAAAAASLGSTSGITVNSLGTLLLGGANNIDRINNLADVSLAGGTFNTGGLNEGPAGGASGASAEMGALTLSLNSTIDFTSGTGSNLLFSSLIYTPGEAISIRNWTGTINTDDGSVTNDRLLFTTVPGFTDAQLQSIQFFDDLGTAFNPGATLISFNGYSELVPVPEPSAVVGALALLGLAGYRERRRAAALRRASRQSGSNSE